MQSILGFGIRSASCAAALAALAGCQTGSAFRDPLARMNPDMQAVVVAYQASGAQPVSRLTVAQARSQPTLGDAARTVEQAQTGRPFALGAPLKITEMTVPGAAGPLQARLYDPAPGHAGQPIVLYFHGGGGVMGSLDTGDAAARALAANAHAMVLSVAYRLAPEAVFPAAQDDAMASYRWLLDNAASLGADRNRIAIAGESVGATIALDTAVAARDSHIKLPVHELLIEPVVSADTQTRSEIANQNTVPFSRADEEWSFRNWVSGAANLADPRIDLLGAADLRGLPPTTIISSEMDPLESDGTTVTQKLQASGVDVTRIEYQGTANGFFGLGAVVARAHEAQIYAGNALKVTFDQIGPPPAAPQSAYQARGRAARHRVWHRPKGS
jgi:acetyl esterase/lipase